MKCLIVEDDPNAREALRRLLVGEGYEVCTAWTCSGAIQQLTIEKPDIVLLDVDLGEPVLSGLDVARVMGGDPQWRSIPVIVTSAIPVEEIRERARGSSVFEGLHKTMMVTKPIEFETLVAEIRAMLGVV